MSAGTRWFCGMQRKTVTVSSHRRGFHHPKAGEQWKPTPLGSFCFCQGQKGGSSCFGPKDTGMLRVLYTPLTRSHLRKEAPSSPANAASTRWRQPRRRPRLFPGWRSCRCVQTPWADTLLSTCLHQFSQVHVWLSAGF